jgi:hypothetical protein
MTPALSAVYDDLVQHAADGRFAAAVRALRDRFAAKTGAFGASDAWFEERTAAHWDRVLTDRATLRTMRAAPPPSFGAAHHAALDALDRAQRGLFELRRVDTRAIDACCVVGGGSFRIADDEELLGRLLAPGDEVAPGLLDGHVVPTARGVALLPGLLLHDPAATPHIRALIDRVAASEPSTGGHDALLDKLLAMRHRFAARSRMRVHQVYRPESIDDPPA